MQCILLQDHLHIQRIEHMQFQIQLQTACSLYTCFRYFDNAYVQCIQQDKEMLYWQAEQPEDMYFKRAIQISVPAHLEQAVSKQFSTVIFKGGSLANTLLCALRVMQPQVWQREVRNL